MNHDHIQNCNHNIAYCFKCDVCYCTICDKEWIANIFTNSMGIVYKNYTAVEENGQTVVRLSEDCGHKENSKIPTK